jgi:fructosamine-3-kinase
MASLILRIEHALALLHHIQYLNAKTSAYSSLMHGSLWLSPC